MGLIYEKRRFADQESEPARAAQDLANIRQEEFLGKLTEGPASLVEFLCRLFLSEDQSPLAHFPDLPCKLTPSTVWRLPTHDELQVGAHLAAHGIVPVIAAQPAFWFLCHVRWIREGFFGNTGSDLEKAFTKTGTRNSTLEDQTRNFLRITGGLPGVRGYTSVLSDCRISGAFWRFHLSSEISQVLSEEAVSAAEASALGFDQVHSVLWHKPVWTALSNNSVKSVTAISAPRGRAALVAALWERQAEGTTEDPPWAIDVTEGQANAAIQAIGILSQRISLFRADWDLLVHTAREGLKNGTSGNGSSD